MTDLSPNSLNANLKIVKTEIKPSGEAIQVVRPLVSSAKTTDQIVGELVNRFDYRSGEVKASENELNTVQQAFGSNLANELIKTYEGSNLVSDSQQDLVGDKYLAEQIRMIQEQQKTTSILDKWGHLLYEGERDYKSAVSTGSKTSLTGGQSIGNGTSNCNSGSGGYATTYSNGSIAHYNQLIEEHNKKLQQQQQQEEQEQQQQPDMIQQYQEQLQQEQQDLQEQQEAAIQQAVAAVQQQEAAAAAAAVQSALRSSQSGNLAASNSNHRLLAAVNSQNAMASYAQSQSGLQSRTLSEVRLQAQLRAQLEAQAQARAQAQLQAQLQAQAQAQAQALAHARAVEQVRQQQQQQQQTCAQQLNRSMSGIGASSEVRSAIGVSAAPVQSHSQHSLHQQQQQLQHQQSHQSLSQQQNQQQQPQPFLPQLSSNNLKSVTLEAYNSPQFKAMLEQLSKPISVPPEQINYPPEWPSQDKISEYLLAEPIYIPAPQPIVIPAPNIITIESQPLDAPTFSRHDLPDAAVKPTVTYYPSISTDQAHMKNFGIRQLNLDTNLNRTASVINQAQQQQQQHQY